MRLKKEMRERRRAYDEQISSANRERRETLQKEREQENRRLDKLKQKMEEDYYNGIEYNVHRKVTHRNTLTKIY